ncbi:LOW QUALITY PROTEIN: uncharacterized protein [Palaemon carinicauda]|uniref:LOW QUALITY PROTEIN: uncharacterized protein n=1 Tax=Palaemon carinicauda TaxID=392227 RepID=UPI0035B6781B
MEKLKKTRTTCRGWVTRASKALSDLLESSTTTISQFEYAIKEYNQRLAKLDEVQEALEIEVAEEELEQLLDEAHEFRTISVQPRIQAEDQIRKLAAAACPGSKAGSISGQSDITNVKLPKLELPKFSGEVTQWQSFWDQYNSHIDATDLPVISKFTYLLSLLEGDARNVVKGLAHTSANYQVACKLLKERYHKPERIIFAHVQALLNGEVNINVSGPKGVAQLWKLRDDILIHIRSLEALGITGKQCEVFLTPIILSRLPSELRLEWARDGDGHESDLDWLLTFLDKEISRLERSEAFKGKSSIEVKKIENKSSKDKVYSAAALHASSKQENTMCSFCAKKHKSENCYGVLELSGKERGEKIRSLGLCFKCLKSGHMSRDCKARTRCTKCNGAHSTLMCGVRLEMNLKKEESEAKEGAFGSDKPGDVALLTGQGGNCTILQTAKVQVSGSDGTVVTAQVMFDNGADRSYISSKFVKKCKPQWITSAPMPYSSFGGHSSGKNEHRNVYELKLWDSDKKVVRIIAAEIPRICQPLVRPIVPDSVLNSFSHVVLADDYHHDSPIEIDILIGLDFYWTLISPVDAFQINHVVAMKSLFGYVLSGRLYKTNDSCTYSVPQLLCISSVSDSDLCKFWDLETVGVKPRELVESYSETKVFKEFESTVKFVNGRYEVALPWKDDSAKEKLLNNVVIAHKRLGRLMVKLEHDKELKKEYQKVFDSYESDHIIEEVPREEISGVNPVYYMPHRPVVKLSSSSTKIRPVFDASASCYNGVSLNDCLSSGPSLNPDLVEVLIRFRRWPIAVTADIRKAFLQISVQEKDRDVHRFLWPRDDGTIRHMRFTRVPFGNTASPFLLNATIKHHLDKYPPTSVVQDLKANMYTDNWLSGADSAVEAADKFCEARSILADASMDLTKLVSNSLLITSQLCDKVPFINSDEPNTVLGLKWCNSLDSFSFDGINSDSFVEVVCTKRSILSVIAKIFYPLGLISPYVMYGKILFQELWKLGLTWDQEMPSELKLKFQRWLLSSEHFKNYQIDRCYFSPKAWGKLSHMELHGFGDASEKGYGACVYLRVPVENGSYKVSLVSSKSRVAPIKTITLPRLELMGCLLCSRLVNFVKNTLNLDNCVRVRCWTDSTIALSWIQRDVSKKDLFVANRVKEIRELTPPSCWQHCVSKDNPADLITRGLLADKLVDSTMWLYGPSMLKESQYQEREGNPVKYKDEIGMESTAVCLNVQGMPDNPLIDLDRYSKLSKVLRVTAYVLRFIINCRNSNNKVAGPLITEEIDFAKLKLIYCIQREMFSAEIKVLLGKKAIPQWSKLRNLDPFLDDKGLIRIRGRLEFSNLEYDTKHPVIIPKGQLAKLLIRFQHRFLKHAGVDTVISSLRNNFWIIGMRRLAKTVIKECLSCRWHDSKPCSQPVAPLPKERIRASPPFDVTGLDYAGPLFCADCPSKKFYVLLFTCGVVRAVHLELTESLSLPDCLLAIRRFVARRSLPSVIYSDNAKTFVAARYEVQRLYGHLAPKWNFIAPRAPWWGGWWERLIRSVKLALRKTLNLNYVSKSELETILVEIESCINSRPLTYVSDELDSIHYLTPSHFILGRAPHCKSLINVEPCKVTSRDLNEREVLRNKNLENFWKIWSDNYITNLPQVVKGFNKKCDLSKGDLVLIKEDNLPRLKWPLGVIVDVFKGRDGLVRFVRLKTKKGEMTRPIQRLYNLEVGRSEDLITTDASCDDFERDVCDNPQMPIHMLVMRMYFQSLSLVESLSLLLS